MASGGAMEVPIKLKEIKPYLQIANEIAIKDPIVAYYCRFYAIQKGLGIDKSSPECRQYIVALMDSLEAFKKQHAGEEALRNELIGRSMVESLTVRLFQLADQQDRASQFGPDLIKKFYKTSLLFEVLTQFPADEGEAQTTQLRKYTKWKAAYLLTCAKTGEAPKPGPPMDEPDFADLLPSVPGTSTGGPADFHSQPKSTSSSSSIPAAPKVTAQAPVAPAPVAEAKDGGSVNSALFQQASKYAKYAQSALQYEDGPTAIDYLQRALRLLQTGSE